MGRHSVTIKRGKWNNLAKPSTDVPVLGTVTTREEAVVELFDDATRNAIDLRLVQVDPLGSDPHRCIAVVGGRAVAEVVVTHLLRIDSPLERNLVAQARHSAIRAGRPDPLVERSAAAVPRGVAEEPTDWEPAEFTTPDAPVLASQTVAITPAPEFDMGRAEAKKVLGADDLPEMPWLGDVTGGVRPGNDRAKVEGWE